jgi:exonuclease III
MYVALSRSTVLQNLFLYGAEKFTRQKYDMKKAILAQKTNAVHAEIKRMKTDCPLIDKFDYVFNETPDPRTLNHQNSTVILFHNVQNLSYNIEQISADRAVKVSDILLFTECHSNLSHHNENNLRIPGFNLVMLTGRDKDKRSNGCAIYVKESLQAGKDYNVVANNAMRNLYYSTDITEINLLTIRNRNEKIYICFLYKHPKAKSKDLWKSFESFLQACLKLKDEEHIREKMFVFGDFNFDQTSPEANDIQRKMKNTFGLNTQLVCNSTTDRKTTIDWCITNESSLTNKQRYELKVYESYFSYHKPLVLLLEK